MNSPADRANSSTPTLQAALLDYFQAPGKYQLSLRQPALLFSSIRQVLQLASGRSPGGEEQRQDQSLREAAAFFIRAALLYPGATHYAVMGLPPRMEPIELKERYRLLMRLIHPDFAAAHAQTWPGDAAVRVNRAYEVLSSPVLRAEYDEQLGAPVPQRIAAKPKMDAPLRETRHEAASWRFNRAAVWVLIGSGCVVGLASLVPWQGPDQLVQKVDAPAPVAVEQPLRYEPPVRAQALAIADVPREPAHVLAPVPPSPAVVSAPAPVHTPPLAAVAPAPHAPVRAEPPVQLRASASVPAPKPQPVPPARGNPPAPMVVAAAQAPRLVASLQLGEPVAPRPPERRPEPALPAPVAQPVPIPLAVVREEAPRPLPLPVAAPIRVEPVARASGTEPSLNDAQPLLTLLLQSMEGGSGEQMLRLLESDARRAPAALALSRQYDQLVGQARPVRLSHVEFRSEAREGVLLVTGKVRLHAGEPTIGSFGERISLRAEFVSRGGKVLLTGLSGAPD